MYVICIIIVYCISVEIWNNNNNDNINDNSNDNKNIKTNDIAQLKDIENFNDYNNYTYHKSENSAIDQPKINYYPNNGFQPLVFTNSEIFPELVLGCYVDGDVSFFISLVMQKYVYPFILNTYNNDIEILNDIINNNIHMGFIREYIILNKINNNDDINDIVVIAPTYYETVFCVANLNVVYDSLSDIVLSNFNNTKYNISYIARDYDLVKEILSFNNIDIDINTDNITITSYDNIDELVNSNNRYDILCLCCHPKNKQFQQLLLNNTNKLLNIFSSKLLQSNINTIKLSMKSKFPWIFHIQQYSISKLPKIVNNGLFYNTFQVRSLLCCKKTLLKSSTNKNQHLDTVLPRFTKRFIELYQTIQLNIDKWNVINNSNMLFDNTDTQSFNFNSISTIPKPLKIHPDMLELLQNINKIQIHYKS
jgi:hypothetical protein